MKPTAEKVRWGPRQIALEAPERVNYSDRKADSSSNCSAEEAVETWPETCNRSDPTNRSCTWTINLIRDQPKAPSDVIRLEAVVVEAVVVAARRSSIRC
jgi:hypothetical protein